MSNRIDTREALRLWLIWRNWREVACRLIRPNGQTFTAEAARKAVWAYHRGQR